MKTTRRLFLIATVSALLGACSRTQTPETATSTKPATPDANTNTAEQTVKLSGTVADSAGQPIAGATVECWHYEGNFLSTGEMEVETQTNTAADGSFELHVAPGTDVLLARKAGLAPAWRQTGQPYSPLSETENKLVLTPPESLEGVVVDESNQPVANAEVFVTTAFSEIALENGGRMFAYVTGKPARNNFSARTDRAGHFSIGGFPTNAAAIFAVRSPGKVLRISPDRSLDIQTAGYRAGETNIHLVVEPAGSIEGKISGGESNQPPPVARLRLQPDEGNSLASIGYEPVLSEPDGAFRFNDVAAGSYRVLATFGTNASSSVWVAEAVPASVESGQVTRGISVVAKRGAGRATRP